MNFATSDLTLTIICFVCALGGACIGYIGALIQNQPEDLHDFHHSPEKAAAFANQARTNSAISWEDGDCRPASLAGLVGSPADRQG